MSDQQWPPRQPGEGRPERRPGQPHQGQPSQGQPHQGQPHQGQPRPGQRPGSPEQQGSWQPPVPGQRAHPGQQPGAEGQQYPGQAPRPGQQPYSGPRPGRRPAEEHSYGGWRSEPEHQQPYPPQRDYPTDPRQPNPPGGQRSYGSEQHRAFPPDPQVPYPADPYQPYPEQQHYPDQPYGDQPYADQPYAEQPYADQPYAEQQPYSGQQPPAYPSNLGPGRFGPEPSRKRRWPKVVLTVLLLAVVGVGGYGAYDFYDQTETWKQTTTDDMSSLGGGLSVAVASMRNVGWEVTADHVAALLAQPGADEDGLRLRTLATDETGKKFSIAGYRTWQDTYAKRDHTTVVCADIALGEGTKAPVSSAVVACPDDVTKSAPAAGDPELNGVAANLSELVRTATEGSTVATTENLLEVAAPTRPVGDVRAESTALRCAPGTRDLGEGEGYDKGKLIPVRLCAVEGLPNTGTESTKGDPSYIDGSNGLTVVNARISGAAAALVEKAAKQKIDLVASSSFRTMQKQKSLCAKDLSGGCQAGDYTLTAKPGFSSHQLGIAIDFEDPSAIGGKTCATRATEPASPVWTFLNKAALGFGLKQYAPEAWHWDAYGGKDRCAPL